MPMKKLYKRGKVHPSLTASIDDYLAFLPCAILSLTTPLSGEEKRVLAYLISWSNNKNTLKKDSYFSSKNGKDQPHAFNCDCFECYTNVWARWNSSPNRRLINDVIEAYEEELTKKNKAKSGKMKRNQRKKNNVSRVCDEPENEISDLGLVKEENKVEESADLRENNGGEEEDGEVEIEKGTCRRLFNFIGEKISGFWNMG
ncbi:hypothetical protein TIFTF001_001865 [Ficus carica]|uniref:Uncharacterized protein n=1 Tax=Ficus carica TaxID=3494 RepID=A0AA87Z3G4_FICCA|nr:hypothetical protein TIFTF001_001865 [Ficus carica]